MVKSEANGAKKIILAIGNPGKEYENTYHNAGVLALEAILLPLAKNGDAQISEVSRKDHKKLFAYAMLGDTTDLATKKTVPDTVFVRSLTFMNESGKAAREALKKFGAKPENLIVLQDDSDIAIGDFKISFARNSAGHKGIQSIIDALGTKAFTRVRIGIRPVSESMSETSTTGAPTIKRKKAGEFALKTISARNRKILAEVFIRMQKSLKTNN